MKNKNSQWAKVQLWSLQVYYLHQTHKSMVWMVDIFIMTLRSIVTPDILKALTHKARNFLTVLAGSFSYCTLKTHVLHESEDKLLQK